MVISRAEAELQAQPLVLMPLVGVLQLGRHRESDRLEETVGQRVPEILAESHEGHQRGGLVRGALEELPEVPEAFDTRTEHRRKLVRQLFLRQPRDRRAHRLSSCVPTSCRPSHRFATSR